MAYKLELPEELSNVHNTFHISNLKKCLSDESLVIPMKELRLDDKLNFMEEPIEIIDREVKQLRKSCILIVKDVPRMAVRIDKDKVIVSPSLEQVVSHFKLVSFAEQVCITPMKDYQMETDNPPLISVSINENNSSDYGTNQLSVVNQPNRSTANNNTTDVWK
ncbi:hypothetical protein Tco_0034490, partial [Tanacetum coccineum]